MLIMPTKGGTGNWLLDLLPETDLSVLLNSSKVVVWKHGQQLFRQDGPITHVCFPTGGAFGAVILMEDGKAVEGTTIGREGMVGVSVLLDLDFSLLQVVCQVPGATFQVPIAPFLQTVRELPTLNRLLLRYTGYRMRCAIQIGTCNALHNVEERLARWLLMVHDRVGKDDFMITHAFLSELLGVRRQTVSITAGILQKAGYITYRRGLLTVLDRGGLESASCECYEVLKTVYNRAVRP